MYKNLARIEAKSRWSLMAIAWYLNEKYKHLKPHFRMPSSEAHVITVIIHCDKNLMEDFAQDVNEMRLLNRKSCWLVQSDCYELTLQ